MPKVSKESATQGGDHGQMVEQTDELGPYTVNFLLVREDVDHRPLFQALPGGQCHCPHWGYVFKGELAFDFGDHEEVYRAGEAFYTPPGHVPARTQPGTEYVQFSPADQLKETSAAIMRAMEDTQAT